jgi:hypothetical protein
VRGSVGLIPTGGAPCGAGGIPFALDALRELRMRIGGKNAITRGEVEEEGAGAGFPPRPLLVLSPARSRFVPATLLGFARSIIGKDAPSEAAKN